MNADPATTDRTPAGRRRTPLVAAALAGVVILAAAWAWLSRPTPLPPGVGREEYAAAEEAIRRKFRRDPGRAGVLSYLGERAYADGRFDRAVACFRAVPGDDPEFGPAARLQEGQALLKLNRAVEAERALREFLARAARAPRVPPGHLAAARRAIAYLLSVELRFDERRPILADLHRSGAANVNDSKQYHFPTLLISRSAFGRGKLDGFLESDPDDPRLLVALGRYQTGGGDLDAARRTLESLRRRLPRDLECAAALSECHYEAGARDRFDRIVKALPGYAPGEPTLLTQMRGQHALVDGRPADAVASFERVLAVDPANPICRMGVARAYGDAGRLPERERALRQSLVLSRIRVMLPKVTDGDAAAMLELAEECERAGLAAAAATFRGHAERASGASPDGRGANRTEGGEL